MRKNAIALAITAALAVVLLVPLGLRATPAPQAAIDGEVSAQPIVGEGDQSDLNLEGDSAQEASDAESEDVTIEAEHVPGVVLVGLDEGVSIDQVNERLGSLDYVTTDAVAESDVVYGYVELALAEGVEVGDAMSRLREEDFVAAAQPNFVYHLLDDAEEPTSGQDAEMGAASVESAASSGEGPLVAQSLDMTAQATGVDPERKNQWGLTAIGAISAWDTAKGNHKVTVAVLDTGLDMDHSDFADGGGTTNVVGGYSVLQANKKARGDRSADPNNYDDCDPNGHGTHVAGIISAGTNNAVKVAGVSYNANVMPVQVIDENEDVSSADAAAGVNYVVNNAKANNVRVINISFGSKEAKSASDEPDTLFLKALESAHQADILVVFAAGNGGNGKSSGAYDCFPCDADPEGLGVIAVKEKNGTAGQYETVSSSNCNKAGQRTKELSAPGYSILSTLNNDKTGYKNGTSMAAPFVSGTAALMFAANSNLTAEKAKEYLEASAKDIGASGWDNETGYGLVNAKDAVYWAENGHSVKTIDSCTIKNISDQSYTGREVKPTLSVSYGGTQLTEGTDYVVTYQNNIAVGTATAIVSGKGAYFGDKKKTFTIKGKIASVTASPSSYTHTGSAIKPTNLIVKGNDGKTLKEGTDYYTPAYTNNTAVGTATVTVTGKGNYSGTVNSTFAITAKSQSSQSSQPTATGQPLYRLYHPETGEHHYTLSAYERDYCVAHWGWTYEGIAWNCPSTSSTPVYRLYNSESGLHHYTTSAYERDYCVAHWGWTYEGVAWYSDDAKGQPLYRLYQPSSGHHHYTLSAYERDYCIAHWGWNSEGVAWYGLK